MAEVEIRPGSRYRELMRATGLPSSTFALNTASMQKLELLKVKKKEGATRFYPPSMSDRECELVGLLYQTTAAILVRFLLENDDASFKELVKAAGKAPSTVSHHLKRLKEDGVVIERFYGNDKTFSIVDGEEISSVFKKYESLIVS